RKRRAKAHGRTGAVAIGAVMAGKVEVIEGIKRLGAKKDLRGFVMQRETAAHERIEGEDWPTAPGIAADHGAVDHGPVRGGAGVAAVGHAGDVIEWKAAGQRGYAACFDLERPNP